MKITTPQTFDRAVTERANERVQAKIKKLKSDIEKAIKDFGYDFRGFGKPKMDDLIDALANKPPAHSTDQRERWKTAIRGYAQCALIAISTDVKLPKYIWIKEEALVESELLATLDEMSKAMLACKRERPEGEVEQD